MAKLIINENGTLTIKDLIIERGCENRQGEMLDLRGLETPTIEEFNRMFLTKDFNRDESKIIGEINHISKNINKLENNVKSGMLIYVPKQYIKNPDLFVEIIKTLYPAIGGRILESEDGVIKKFKLMQISLCVYPNRDPNILSIGEQIK